MKRKHQQAACSKVDLDQIQTDLQSADESVRARAVQSLCPCHSEWEEFEQYMEIVAQLQKDSSPIVRKAALHVFEDAAQIESSGYPTNPREVTNEMLRTKRASRFPLEAEDVAEKKNSKRRSSKNKAQHAII